MVDLHIKAFVGSKDCLKNFHVFELSRQLPKFSMYSQLPEGGKGEGNIVITVCLFILS